MNATESTGGISIHAVDVSRARKARGLKVSLFRTEADRRRLIANGEIAPNALFDHPIVQGEGITEGDYEVEFRVADYYRAQRVEVADPPFLDIVVFPFTITDIARHIHLPFKMTPWGYSLFRGNP